MRYKFAILIAFYSVFTYSVNAFGDYIDFNITGDRLNISNDTEFADSVFIDVERINVLESLRLINHGNLDADIYVSDNLSLMLQNSGTIHGDIYSGSGSNVIQVITNADDITKISVVGDYAVMVTDAHGIGLADVVDIANGANKLVLNNSELILNDDGATFGGTTEIRGNLVVMVNPDTINAGRVVLQNVAGDGVVIVNADGLNPLYAAVSTIYNNNLYIDVVRETNYYKIFENDVGRFLNIMRDNNPDDKLLRKMDSANDMGVLNAIMARAVRLNPVNLMKPIRKMHKFNDIELKRLSDGGVVGHLSYIFNGDTDIIENKLRLDIRIDNKLKLYLTGNAGIFNVDDEVDVFSGAVGAVGIGGAYDDGIVIGNVFGEIGAAKFGVGPVFYNGRITDNPYGTFAHYDAKFGMRVLDYCSVEMIPFAGVRGDVVNVAGDLDMDINDNFGFDVSYSVNDWDVKYKYGFNAGMFGRADVYLNLGMKFILPDDDMSGGVSVGVLRDDVGTSYKISAMMKYTF